MSPIETRKRLLIAESEVHRAQVFAEVVEWAETAGGLARRVTAASALATAVVVAGTGWLAVRNRKAGVKGGAGGRTWLPWVSQALGMLTTLWMAWRSSGRGEGGPSKTSGPGKEQS
jgi:hypothetical protein